MPKRLLPSKLVPRYKDPDVLELAVKGYFESCWAHNDKGERTRLVEPYTMSGLGLAIGMSVATIGKYAKKEGKMGEIISYAKQVCEQYAEKVALSGKNQAGAIFVLKNHGWADKKQVEINDTTERTVEELRSELIELQRDSSGTYVSDGVEETGTAG